MVILTGLIGLVSCEYSELMDVTINGNTISFNQDQVTAFYQTIGSQTSSVVYGDDGVTAVTINVQNNVNGTYTCSTGSNPIAKIYIIYSGTTYSTEYLGSSGTIVLLSAGANLIEGTFNGTVKNFANTSSITVTNGQFSGRAY